MQELLPGLFYVKDYLSEDEHQKILTFLKGSPKWMPVGSGAKSRKVIHYGYEYAYNRSGVNKTEDLPFFLSELVKPERVNQYREILPNPMNQLIINEYLPGQGIAAHIDHVKQFGPIIVCLSVGAGIEINFIKDGVAIPIYIEPKSMYIMSGLARYEYSHSIAARKYDNKNPRSVRTSLTYRQVLI